VVKWATFSVVVQARIWRHAGVLTLTLVDAVNTLVKRAALRRHANVLRSALHGLPVEGSALIVLEVALLADRRLPGETREQRKNERNDRKRRNHDEYPFW
jgi:hypothetical protein